MIWPEPRHDGLNQRGKAFITTTVLAGVCYSAMTFGGIELMTSTRSVYREVDLSALTRSTIESSHAMALLDSLGSSQIELPVDWDQPDTTVYIDNGHLPDSSDYIRELDLPADIESPDPDLSPAYESEEEGTENRRSDNTQTLSLPAASIAESVGIEEEYIDSSAPSNLQNIRRVPLEAFGVDYANLEISAIIRWMEQNPADLPQEVRQIMRYRPDFLSSASSFRMEGEWYTLYLMSKKDLSEVHVILVDSKEAVYLVDRSYQKLSTYLRKGRVLHEGGATRRIEAVRSNMVSSESSDYFYTTFLSWWDFVKRR